MTFYTNPMKLQLTDRYINKYKYLVARYKLIILLQLMSVLQKHMLISDWKWMIDKMSRFIKNYIIIVKAKYDPDDTTYDFSLQS